MKQTIKLMSLLLTLVMVLSVFAACTPAGNGDSSTPALGEASTPAQSTPTSPEPSESTPEESSPVSTSEDLAALIPPKMNLDREMSIFVGELYDKEWLDKDDGDLVGTELYNRVLRVENNLGIELTVTSMFGDGPKQQIIMEEIQKRQESSDPNLITDICSTYSAFAGALTIEGRYQNINNSDYINLENPWWPKDLLENSAIDDKIYFVSGDISPTLIYEIYAIFYNRLLVEKYNMDDPIELVNDHKWTIDKLIEMTSDIYEDLDTTKIGPSEGDFYALNFNDAAHLKSFPFSMGIRVLLPDEENGYEYAEVYYGMKMDALVDKLASWFTSNPGVSHERETNGWYDFGKSFLAGNCIFNVGNFGFAKNHLAGSGLDYAVVPCPMYNEEQEAYYSSYGNPSSFWGVPSNANIDDACALLESLGADAYVYISPALFERALKFKYVTGDISGLSKMFDIIREGLVFDACVFYQTFISSGYNGFYSIGYENPSWTSTFNAFKIKGMNASLKKDVVDKLRNLPY